MPWSTVSWSFQATLVSSKLAQMVENLRVHDHRFDGTQGPAQPRWASGRATVTTVANGVTDVPITYPAGRFVSGVGAPPVELFVSPDVATGVGTNLLAWGASASDPTGGTGYLYRTTATSTGVDWFAVQR